VAPKSRHTLAAANVICSQGSLATLRWLASWKNETSIRPITSCIESATVPREFPATGKQRRWMLLLANSGL
ncbi:hypothetical protein AALO_G00002370, partial [Alosa alosa]